MNRTDNQAKWVCYLCCGGRLWLRAHYQINHVETRFLIPFRANDKSISFYLHVVARSRTENTEIVITYGANMKRPSFNEQTESFCVYVYRFRFELPVEV